MSLSHSLVEGRSGIEQSLDILDRQFSLGSIVIPTQVQSDNIVLQLQVILFPFVKTTKDKDLPLVFIATGAHTGRQGVSQCHSPEEWLFVALFGKEDLTENAGVIRPIEQFVKKCL